LPAGRPLLRWAVVFLAIPWDAIAQADGISQVLGLFSDRDFAPALAAVSGGGRLPEDVWKARLDAANVPTLRATLELIAIKLPTWSALAIVVWASFPARRAARPPAAQERSAG
jgi:hypothetical protein